MAAQGQTRTIRLSKEDVRDIEKFLHQNAFLDFSTLARLAIRRFIESPDLKVRGIRGPVRAVRKGKHEVNQ